jgi:hypothetical protein
MLKKFEKEIEKDEGGTNAYSLIQHPGIEGYKLLPKVLKIAGKALGPLLSGQSVNVQNIEEMDLKEIAPAIEAISLEIISDPDLIFEVLKYTKIKDGNALLDISDRNVFNKTFQGSYFELAQVVWFAIDANFMTAIKRKFFVAKKNPTES